MQVRSGATCGLCDLSGYESSELRKCSVCQGHLCLSVQKGPRSVCEHCILSNLGRLERIFVNGKDAQGRWLDPGTLLAIPTCKHCGQPQISMRCGPIIGCHTTPGTSAPNVRRMTMEEGMAHLRDRLN